MASLWRAGGVFLFLAATPALAQTPALPPPAPDTLGPSPTVTLNFGSVSGGFHQVHAEGVHLNYGGELTVDAARLDGKPYQSQYQATGGVRAHANDTTLTSDSLYVDGLSRLGFSEGAMLTRRPFTLRANRIDFQPNGLTAMRANVTTAKPQDKPDIELRVGTLTVTPEQKAGKPTGRQHVVLHDASLYLLHNHIITLRNLVANLGNQPSGPARRQPARPGVGYSGRYGFYVSYGNSGSLVGQPIRYNLVAPLRGTPQVRVTSSQALLVGPALRPETPLPVPITRPHDPLTTLRLLTTAPRPLLPDGDPLLFHDFLPDGNPIRVFDTAPRANISASEELSYHVEATGRGRNDLFVSRYPEVSVGGNLPLTRAYALPAPDDADAFRHYLRHLTLYVGADVDLGRFHEQPTNIDATRQRYTFRLSARPLLIAPNTVILPSYSVTTNRYTGIGPFHTFTNGSRYLGSDSGRTFSGDTYSYGQYSLALNHYFSPYSAVGVQYIVSQPGGDSPFNFDVLDTTRELDGRLQVGNHRLAVAGSIRYDALHPHVIDYTLAVAPGLHGFTPVFSYSFFSRAFGVGFQIPGLTF